MGPCEIRSRAESKAGPASRSIATVLGKSRIRAADGDVRPLPPVLPKIGIAKLGAVSDASTRRADDVERSDLADHATVRSATVHFQPSQMCRPMCGRLEDRSRIAVIALATSIYPEVTSHLHSSRGSRPPAPPSGHDVAWPHSVGDTRWAVTDYGCG
jgi:hypothetical protein